jgi:type I restriction enzyme R subunit
MIKLTENTIKQSLIDQLISLGYTYYIGTDISPISTNPQRENVSSVILEQHFKDSLKNRNPWQFMAIQTIRIY